MMREGFSFVVEQEVRSAIVAIMVVHMSMVNSCIG